MKLVVVGVDAQNRSMIAETRILPEPPPRVAVWDSDDFGGVEDIIREVNPDLILKEVEPAEGHVRWIYQGFLPRSEQTPHHVGVHVTRTIDFDMCVRGRMQCVLDLEVVDLEEGDFIILKAANHHWRNVSDEKAAMTFLLLTPAGTGDPA